LSGTIQGEGSDNEWVTHSEEVRAAKPKIEALLSEVSGWRDVGKLADWVIKLIIANQGRSGHEDVRPPCQEEHAPLTVPEMTSLMAKHFGLVADDPKVIHIVAEHRQKLIEDFGLGTL